MADNAADLYHRDFYAWAQMQAERLQALAAEGGDENFDPIIAADRLRAILN